MDVLACQKNSFLKEFETTVLSCKPSKLNYAASGEKPKTLDGYDVIFTDTILFPEGGGQNDDHGSVNGFPVKRVTRQNGQAVHFVESKEEPFKNLEDNVIQKVDWPRRFDHMQQHSGQHLISAILEKRENMPTSSWWMAENVGNKVGLSYIELDTSSVSPEVLKRTEEACNEAVRDGIDVKVEVFNLGDSNLDKAKTRGLPADHKGPVRVINIGELDSNMCCGTHVSNLSQLQAIKLLHIEKSKKKGKTLLYFIVGERVINYLSNCYSNERALTSALKNGPEDHLDLVDKMTKNLKIYQKSTQNLLKELASAKVEELKRTRPKYFSIHRMETENDYANVLINEMSNEEITLLITSGDDKIGPCQMVLCSSNEDIVKDLGPKLLDVLEAKGGGKGKRLNAKFTSLKKRKAADTLMAEFFAASC